MNQHKERPLNCHWFQTAAYGKQYDAEAAREHGPDITLEVYYCHGDDRSIALTTSEREAFEREIGIRLDAEILFERNFEALHTYLIAQLPTKLTCPHCNYQGEQETEHGGTFRMLSRQTIWREIYTEDCNATQLAVEGQSQTYDEDEETDDRIECRNCLREFPVPANFQVEYV